ncbi:citrate lyase subunit beta/citryl-CoA lyase [Variovorax beijingensis]|jgi:citrate lyase subunit beta/citryl-CoA lyase|uniref:Citrate lyase subunit beta/citryl-CoA lyase n=3 Tax=Variovorax TaxID=34072 RepID=A0AAE4C0V0_VARPD|nr:MULTISPECIES: CoA ester lyase [Variovorax]MBD9665277.1 CoA ester lyase [Variovorax sp. VRV01]MDP9967046.1 citrate lyase subunit beta/citryl-CoA lyase [Variovorax paradoxus]MDR6429544.1 citrate lyase subunit beta/citryl-CoA lyase [Variovorax paradoxus]TWD76889.1 citrate lyase subunit beta/citryl-CoA lyase [Variovorax beijingensis]
MPTLPRSYLFVPGDRPERFDKAAASGAHRMILDLEDAVASTEKAAARDAVAQWLAAHAGLQSLVRVNAVDTPWHDDDLRMLRQHPYAGLMLPKAEPGSVLDVLPRLEGARERVMLVETVAGLLGLRALAAVPGVGRVAFGSIDFGVDAGMADGDDEPGMTAVRVQIALESRHAGLPPPIDGVTPAFGEDDPAGRQAGHARRLGFGAKLCIHPRQVEGVNAAFAPSAQERDWAVRVLAAFEASGGAVVAVDGKMVDRPVVERARRILAIGS